MPSTPSWTYSARTVSSTSVDGLSPRRTRGRTRPGRLSGLDAVLMHCEAALLARADGSVFCDVGIGDWPWTTLESAARFRAFDPTLRVLGVDLDAERVQRARVLAGEVIEIRHGGFALPLEPGERARLIRAMNVLRGYDEDAARDAHQQLSAALAPGGLLIEGTSSTEGGVLCAHWLRKSAQGLAREAMLFLTDFSQGFSPWLFRDRLPRDLRRHVHPGAAIHAFFAAWDAAFQAARSTGVCESGTLFALSALALARKERVVLDPALIEHGALLWRPDGGVPASGTPSLSGGQ